MEANPLIDSLREGHMAILNLLEIQNERMVELEKKVTELTPSVPEASQSAQPPRTPQKTRVLTEECKSSTDSNTKYTMCLFAHDSVDQTIDWTWACTCPDHKFRNKKPVEKTKACKHIRSWKIKM